jgi:hypothetical protein
MLPIKNLLLFGYRPLEENIADIPLTSPLSNRRKETSLQATRRWESAIHKTMLQVRIVKVFTLPPQTDTPSVRSSRQDLVSQNQESAPEIPPWEKLRLYINASSAFRLRNTSSVSVPNPKAVRNALVISAKKRVPSPFEIKK